MSEQLQLNLECLKQYRLSLYEQIIPFLQQSSYNLVFNEDGTPNIEVKLDQSNIQYMYTKSRVDVDCMTWAESLGFEKDSEADIIMYGLGLTHHLAAYLTRHPKHQLFLYEPNIEVFVESLKVISLADLLAHNNIRYLAVGKDEKTIAELSYYYFTYAAKMQSAVTTPFYDDLDAINSFEKIISKYVINFKSREMYMDSAGHQQKINLYQNLIKVLTSPSLSNYKGIWKGKKAIIVGAGPSLQYDISLLKEKQNEYIIIAAGTSIQALIKNNIKPHLIVSMDAYESNNVAFSHIDLSDIPFLFIPTINCKILEKNAPLLIHAFFSHIKEYKYIFNLNENIDPIFVGTHTVTGTAIQAAIYMGVKEIILTGQDLSYPDHQIYFSDTTHLSPQQEKEHKEAMTETVENVNGGFNVSSLKMKITLMDIEDLIATYDDIKFINCSQGGAMISGTTYQLLSEVHSSDTLLYSRVDFIEDYHSYKSYYTVERREQVLQRLLEQQDWFKSYYNKLFILEKKLNDLEKLSRTNPNRCMKTLGEVEQLWGSILGDQNFQDLIENFILDWLRKLDRMIPHIQKEADLKLKTKLLRETLTPVIDWARRFSVKVEEYLTAGLEKAKAASTVEEGEASEKSY